MKNGNLTVYSKTAFRSALLTKYVVQKSYNSRYRLDYLNEVIGSLQKIALDSSITAIENDTAKSLYRDCVDLYIRATVYAASLKRDFCLYDALNELCDFLYEELARGSFPISSVPLSDYLCRYTSTLFKDKSLLKNKEYWCFIDRYNQYKDQIENSSNKAFMGAAFSLLDQPVNKSEAIISRTDLKGSYQKRKPYIDLYRKGEYATGLRAFISDYVRVNYSGFSKSSLYRERSLLQKRIDQLLQQKSTCEPKSLSRNAVTQALTEKESELFTLNKELEVYRKVVKEATAKYRALWNKKKNIISKEETVIQPFAISGKKKPNSMPSRKELFSQYMVVRFPKPIKTKKYNLAYRKVQLEKRLSVMRTVLQSKEVESLGISKTTLSELLGIQSLLSYNIDAITKALRRFNQEYKDAKKQFDLATAKGMDAVQALIEQASPVSVDYFPRVKFVKKTTEANSALSALLRLVLTSKQDRNKVIDLFSMD